MNSLNKNISFLVIVLSFLLRATILNAQSIKTPFNANEIIEQVSQYNNLTGSREGEFLIDTNGVCGPDISTQCSPSVAFDNTNYLVVWEDNRSGTWDIFGARVNQAGVVLDTAGIVIAATTVYPGSPSVAFDGTNYFVVWVNDWLNSCDIYGARVDQSGNVLDPDGIAISTAVFWQESPSIAFDGTDYLVVWQDYRSGIWGVWDIYGARVDQSGIVLDTAGIAIAATADNQYNPSIAFDSTNYMVVWQDYRSGIWGVWDIYGARVDQSGIVLDTAGIAISTAGNDQEFPSIAFDNINYLVVWQDCRNTSNPDIYGARVDQSGNVLDPTGIAVSTAPGRQKLPSIGFDNTNYLVVWEDYRRGEPDIFSARISQSGIVLDPDGVAISIAIDDQYKPSVTFDGTNYLVVWEDNRDVSFDIFGTRVDQAGTVLDTAGIDIAILIDVLYYYEQCNPSVIFGNTDYLVVWHEDRGGQYSDIYGARVNQSGVVLDTAMIAISTVSDYQIFPSVAFDGTDYLIVWQDSRSGPYDIFGARVNQAGIVLDTVGIAICTAAGSQWYPSVAFDNTNYLVIWEDLRSGPRDIFGARVDQSGNVLDTAGIAICSAAGSQWSLSVVFDSTNYLVVWQDSRSGPYDIYGARVNQAGIVLDTAGIAICTAAGSQWYPSVAFDNTNYLVVWQDERFGPRDIFGARVDQSGIVLDTSGIAICTSGGSQLYPSVTFDGTDYLIVWQDSRSGPYDIYGAKVSSSGAVINSYAIVVQPGHQKTPALAHGTADSILITYSGWTDSINTHPVNTMRIWGKFYPFVGIEENAPCPMLDARHLLQVYPNPIHKQCNIKYILPQATKINISMFDVAGRLIKEIINENQNVGIYHKVFDMRDLPQGIYFITLNTDDYSDAKKVIFIK